MNRNNPLVSVLVPCFNHERYIEQALDSVADQTFTDLELVVTDDASSDRSLHLIDQWVSSHSVSCRVIANSENLGLTRTLNLAIPHLSGRYVALMGGDDWMEPDRIERQVAFLEAADGGVSLVMGDARLVDEDGQAIGEIVPDSTDTNTDDQFLSLVERNWIPAPTVMLRRSVYDLVGPYDETLPFEDLDMWLRLADRSRFGYLPGVVTAYRKHRRSLTLDSQYVLVEGKIHCLRRHLGENPERDRAIRHRIARYAWDLHTGGYDPKSTRRHLRSAFRHHPTSWTARALLESELRLPAGSLALRRSVASMDGYPCT